MADESRNGHSKKIQSQEVTDGLWCAPSRSMFRAMGYTDEDLEQPLIGIANPAADVTPCNVHLDDVADAARSALKKAGGTPIGFGTITVSDGISMGTEGMKGSLISREVIADSVELVAFAERLDGYHSMLAALKQQGIYVYLNHLFWNTKSQVFLPEDVFPGYAGEGDKALALLFFSEDFQDYYLGFIERLPGGYPPTRTEPEHPFVQHVCAAGIPVCGEPFVLLPLGPFTQPLHTFADHLGTPVAVVALKRNDSAVHGPNERLPLEDLLRHGQLLMELSSACADQTSSVGQGSTSAQ